MSWSLIASAQGTTITTAVDTTGADLIAVVAADFANVPTITDSKSNVYSTIASFGAGGDEVTMYYVASPVVGTNHTVSATGTFQALAMGAFSGSSATPLDVHNGANGSGITSLATGAITPTVDGCLVVTGIALGGNASTPSVTDGTTPDYTLDQSRNGVSGSRYGIGLAHVAQTTKASINATWSWTNASGDAAEIVSFKPAGGAAFTAKNRRTLGYRVGSRSYH